MVHIPWWPQFGRATLLLVFFFWPQASSSHSADDAALVRLGPILNTIRMACTELEGGDLRSALMHASSSVGSFDGVTHSITQEAAESLLLACDQLLPHAAVSDRALAANGTGDVAEGEQVALADGSTDQSNSFPFRRLVAWLFDDNIPGFPGLQLLFYYLVMLVFVFIFERLVVQSTLFLVLRASLYKALGLNDGGLSPAKQKLKALADASANELPTRAADVERTRFWSKVVAWAHGGTAGNQQQSQHHAMVQGSIAFTHREFSTVESEDYARIMLRREGNVLSQVSVRVRSVESRAAGNFKAQAGTDFEQTEQVLTFAPGSHAITFEVAIYRTTAAWSVPKNFEVELVEVVSGQACLGGPTIAEWGAEDSRHFPVARVIILQEDRFPLHIPQERLSSPFWLAWYYIQDRISARGAKYWKTLFALLYPPFHSIVVSSLVLKYGLDWATRWSHFQEGTYWRILGIGLIQLASTAILRFTDAVQTRNRGRTGGTRMDHRHQLMSKLLLLDFHDREKRPGSHWFYAAVMNVDSMTADGYWQSFMLVQTIWGLLLSVVTLLISNWRTVKTSAVVSMVLLFPIAIGLINIRRHRLYTLFKERMAAESVWVDTFSWVAHSGHGWYSLGPRELAGVEQRWTDETKAFVTKHQAARDAANDSVWIAKWLGDGVYVAMLLWACTRLVVEKRASDDTFKAGSFVVLLKLTKSYGKYLAKLCNSFVKLQKATVSIDSVKDLLNMPTHRSFKDSGSHCCHSSHNEVGCHDDCIELRDVRWEPLDEDPLSINFMKPLHQPMTNMKPLQMLKGRVVKIALNKVVRVTGPSEGMRLTFMALVAKVLRPQQGQVCCSPKAWAVMLPPEAPGAPPGMTVQEAMALGGMPEHLVSRFASALGLAPSDTVDELTPGEKQVLSVARALLRDPAVLVLVRPLAHVVPQQRAGFRRLLRIWQAGGMQQITDWVTEPNHAAAPHVAAVPAGTAGTGARTLVVTAEDMDPEPHAGGGDGFAAGDEFIDLRSVLEMPEALQGQMQVRRRQALQAAEEASTDDSESSDGSESISSRSGLTKSREQRQSLTRVYNR
mmetsp:Transcript_112598/g.223848  ORF Transcript_112598/g.223848 Transcript_112598/m.223848 type:complete len:1069 (-) Transcript_112598:50-3256(-)|eukprot:CAMPEP_0172659788 /NCGR_PEP_ID=MMETSP1074-20121228/3677_1 /TAXON_ID=2916 /ORGANISM="Ceratium fusus, Strain PA161109" /LENGTH=1068 /DNA_ID=CAMNT_0013475335 /DNA_START=48 /DNA_END=3254 /DNA_ORIENTATION=+